MPEYPTATCGTEKRAGCGARIIWTTNVTTGKRMPVDAEPNHERGNVVLTSGNNGPEARVLTRDELTRRPLGTRGLYLSHFATCPVAASFRGGPR